MDRGERLGRLYQYAANHQFDAFDALFSELEASLSFELFWEAYLMRAQIRLFAADPAAMDDLDIVSALDGPPKFACLNTVWETDAPNRFIVFSKEPGSLKRFMDTLPQLLNHLSRWYSEAGEIMARQMQCNLLYWMGDVQESLALTDEALRSNAGTHTDIILMLFARFRSYLAMGETGDAEQCMMEAIRMSKKYPACVAPYLAFRGWANITTSWNGDTPRFLEDQSGTKQPVFDDRLDDIRKGSARITRLETAFVSFAKRHYERVYTLREYYMDVFHAMYWLSVGDKKLADACARRLYEIAAATGLIMPIVECGEQIMPLLRYMQQCNKDIPLEWRSEISAKAQLYEDALEKYRSIHI